MAKTPIILGTATGMTTPLEDKSRIPVEVRLCEPRVPAAAEAVIGQCTYYYRPLHTEFANKDTLDQVRAWASSCDWCGGSAKAVFERLLGERETLIQPESTNPNWSRHASFMIRHIGCGHRPPEYYVSYGYYYCSTFGEMLLPRLTEQGKQWLRSARKFLQKNMERGLAQNNKGSAINIPCVRFPKRSFTMECKVQELEIKNNEFKKFAYGTHVPAYLDAGLTELPLTDLLKIGTQPKANDLYLSGDGLKQAGESSLEVAPAKVKEYARDAYHAVRGTAQDVGQAAADALARLQSVFK